MDSALRVTRICVPRPELVKWTVETSRFLRRQGVTRAGFLIATYHDPFSGDALELCPYEQDDSAIHGNSTGQVILDDPVDGVHQAWERPCSSGFLVYVG
jgi:hypothetical protein